MSGCPKCGDTREGYLVSDRVNGWEERAGDWDGREEMINNDSTRYTLSKTVKCLACGQRVPRPKGAM